MQVHFAKSTATIEKCFPVMFQLRTTITKDTFLDQVKRQQTSGYELVYGEKNGIVVAGFRISENFFVGKFLYIDDLITDSQNRSKGYGDQLFDWLIDYAKKEGCQELHLDSGVQRFDAHRFYLRKRMKIIAHHFSIPFI